MKGAKMSVSRFQFSAPRCSRDAFTLLEVLVAVSILAVMMTFLFNLLGSSVKLWEVGNKRIEAAQAARVGLNIMAQDLQNAFAGSVTSYTTNGISVTNIAPFKSLGSNTTTTMGLGGSSISANGSQQIAGVTLSNNSSIPYNEFGYMSVFVGNSDGVESMMGNRYYLVKKLDSISGNGSGGNFFITGNSTGSSWYDDSTEFYPIIDNCIRLSLQYYGEQELEGQNDNQDSPEWTNSWEPSVPNPVPPPDRIDTSRLPLGVLVTVTVLDSRTAIKVADIKGGDALGETEIDSIFSSSAPADGIETLLRQGAVTMSRFIPLNRN
jgi:prepilin-type N-terminal cleavage/methylation domain-containing protein